MNINKTKRTLQDSASPITLNEIWNEYKKLKNRKSKTIEEYTRAMTKYFSDWQNKPVNSITKQMVKERFEEMSKASKSVANSCFRFLKALLAYAVDEYADNPKFGITFNPCDFLNRHHLWNKIDRRKSFIDYSQLAAFWNGVRISENDTEHMKNVKNHTKMLLFLGCREGEGAKLKKKDVNLIAKKIIFRQENTKVNRGYELPLGHYMCSFFQELLKDKKDDDYIFASNNKFGYLKNHKKQVKVISYGCGVNFCVHDLRRTFLTIANHVVVGSCGAYTYKRLVNHSTDTGDVTAGYISSNVEELRAPMQKIEDFILEKVGENKDDNKNG